MTTDTEDVLKGRVFILALNKVRGNLIVKEEHPIVEILRARFLDHLLTVKQFL